MSARESAGHDRLGVVYSIVEELHGQELAARYRHGTSPLVAYLHGWGRSLADFVGLLGQGDHAAVAFDLPGFGRSTAPLQPVGARGYALMLQEPLRRVRRRVGAESLVLVGHSFGGRVAAEFAGLATKDDALEGVLIVSSPILRPPGGRAAVGYRTVRALRRIGLVPQAALEWARQRWGSADYRAASGVMREVLVRTVNEQHIDALERAHVPIELLWGEVDPVCPVELAKRVAERVPRASLEVLGGVGHDVPREAPQAIEHALERLMQRIGVATRCEDAYE